MDDNGPRQVLLQSLIDSHTQRLTTSIDISALHAHLRMCAESTDSPKTVSQPTTEAQSIVHMLSSLTLDSGSATSLGPVSEVRRLVVSLNGLLHNERSEKCQLLAAKAMATLVGDHGDAILEVVGDPQKELSPAIALIQYVWGERDIRTVSIGEASNTDAPHTHTHKYSLKSLTGRMGVAVCIEEVGRRGLLSQADEINTVIEFLLGLALDDPSLSLDEPVKAPTTPPPKQAGIMIASKKGKALHDPVKEIAPTTHITPLSSWVTPRRLRFALQQAGLTVIETAGKTDSDVVKAVHEKIESMMEKTGRNNPASIRSATAVLLGGVAAHLDAETDTRVGSILNRLTVNLLAADNPSREVQESIAKVMIPLVKTLKSAKGGVSEVNLSALLDMFIEKAVTDANLTVRTGGALGVGAVTRGIGTSAFKDHSLIDILKTHAEDPKNPISRQGAILCFECLSLSMERLFEPYVPKVLPVLVDAFSDSALPVQAAAQTAANAVMSKLSAHGVNQSLPQLLEKMEASNPWASRRGSVELLGATAHCAPKQLAKALPEVFPKICESLNDAHPKVKEAAVGALKRMASVITNKEIKSLEPVLLRALIDPVPANTHEALQSLLKTIFISSVDAPSLAIIVPVVVRAMRERGSQTKKQGAMIVGSISQLVSDRSDLEPYMHLIMPQLQATLIDSSPDVRSTAADAMGTLSKMMSTQTRDEMLAWLFNLLRSGESAVERSGAAIGLSRSLAAMGPDKLSEVLPEILAAAANEEATPELREGYIGLFVYLPNAVESGFAEHLQPVVATLLEGLAAEAQAVRNISLRAAQVVVGRYAVSHSAHLMGPLEEGLFDTDWRIRQACVSLIGTLTDRICRATENAAYDQEISQLERRSFLLTLLFIIRQDTHQMVRQEANRVWKAQVSNTISTVRESLPLLLNRIITLLATPASDRACQEKHIIAGMTVGELVQKLGDSVLAKLMPTFVSTLRTGEPESRCGVCLGLSELFTKATPHQLTPYLPHLTQSLKFALCESGEGGEEVREAASKAAVSLFNAMDGGPVQETLFNWLLEKAFLPPIYSLEELDETQKWKIEIDSKSKLMGLSQSQPTHKHNKHQEDTPHLLDSSTDSSVPTHPLSRRGALDSIEKIVGYMSQSLLNPLCTRLTQCGMKCDLSVAVGLGVIGVCGGNSFSRYGVREGIRVAINVFTHKRDEEVMRNYNGDTKALDNSLTKSLSRLCQQVKHVDGGDKAHGNAAATNLLLAEVTDVLLNRCKPNYDLSVEGSDKAVRDTAKEGCESDPCNPAAREGACRVFEVAASTKGLLDMKLVSSVHTTILTSAIADPDKQCRQSAAKGFADMIKEVTPAAYVASCLSELRSTLARLTSTSSGVDVTGYECEGLKEQPLLDAVVGVYQAGMASDSLPITHRIDCIKGQGHLLIHTPLTSLTASALRLVGPLVRKLSSPNTSQVKVEMLEVVRLALCRITSPDPLKALLGFITDLLIKTLKEANAPGTSAFAAGAQAQSGSTVLVKPPHIQVLDKAVEAIWRLTPLLTPATLTQKVITPLSRMLEEPGTAVLSKIYATSALSEVLRSESIGELTADTLNQLKKAIKTLLSDRSLTDQQLSDVANTFAILITHRVTPAQFVSEFKLSVIDTLSKEPDPVKRRGASALLLRLVSPRLPAAWQLIVENDLIGGGGSEGVEELVEDMAQEDVVSEVATAAGVFYNVARLARSTVLTASEREEALRSSLYFTNLFCCDDGEYRDDEKSDSSVLMRWPSRAVNFAQVHLLAVKALKVVAKTASTTECEIDMRKHTAPMAAKLTEFLFQTGAVKLQAERALFYTLKYHLALETDTLRELSEVSEVSRELKRDKCFERLNEYSRVLARFSRDESESDGDE
eukprot:GHVN01012330.1.p1 GENE.GHVN01012330.1~~GHVN01012330.1.p1  ORF type:complete len:2174 (+),score=530.43 GHVN01012330.1:886-6522(+)